ncbi:MAG: CsgG/HfaB family protein [Treponema sp.]|jgi:TolB-like protein|nr:CsgG/HfaB family protein [Treponema sp.]
MQKKGVFVSVLAFIFTCLMVSCVSLQDKTMTPEERQTAQILGSVTAQWTSTHFLHIANSGNLKNRAYTELKKVAQQRYPGNIDIVNISMAGSFSGWNILWGLFYFVSPVLLDVQKITASGDVISYTSTAQVAAITRSRTQGVTTGIDGAINRACETLIYELPKNTTIAVLSVASRDRDTAIFVMDELEFQLVDSKRFEMVDRKTLDSIRAEQDFQSSGEVSDDSAVSIGNMLGANIVITGSITGSGNTQRLTLKALDVKTAKIVAMAREQY